MPVASQAYDSHRRFRRLRGQLLGAAGRSVARRMFGGFGLYCDGVMFALIADDVLYLGPTR
jgi:DNA transformation protein